jgi:pyrroloquinoline quinone biosynthesis protein B
MLITIMRYLLLLFILLPLELDAREQPFIIVLGVAQDGGYPHMGCTKECCESAWEDPSMRRNVVSLALADPVSRQWYLFEASPDIREQLQLFRQLTSGEYDYLPRAVFVSHAHIGHYTGLMQFGREVMNTDGLTVYAMPRMKHFLENNGPWDQLVSLENIIPVEMSDGSELAISEEITVKSFTVPHRNEYSETAAYKIISPESSYLFIPDIDSWDEMNKDIISLVESSDIAFLDGTFYSGDELPGRNMDEIPHPCIVETMALFSRESKETKKKIHFIHFNHSNPVLYNKEIREEILNKGFNIAGQGHTY